MKKTLIISSVVLLLGVLAATGYWYWQQQNSTTTSVDTLQTVALDNPDIDSFDDVCTEKDEYELDCKGNIEQFGCEHYRNVGVTSTDLNPSYPMLVCEKKSNYEKGEGVYQVQGVGWSLGTTITDYIIIKDQTFQLIQSENQFRQQFQPITNVAEAAGYFRALHKAVLVINDQQLSALKFPKNTAGDLKGTFYVSLESIGLSEVTKTWGGYTFTAYSSVGGDCVDEIYSYRFLLKEDGNLIEKNKKLIWERINKPGCIY